MSVNGEGEFQGKTEDQCWDSSQVELHTTAVLTHVLYSSRNILFLSVIFH